VRVQRGQERSPVDLSAGRQGPPSPQVGRGCGEDLDLAVVAFSSYAFRTWLCPNRYAATENSIGVIGQFGLSGLYRRGPAASVASSTSWPTMCGRNSCRTIHW